MTTLSGSDSNSSNGNAAKRYFNLHATGVGYLNRVREKEGRRGFLACDISALRGASDDVEYTRFDTIVSGTDAQHLVRKCRKKVDGGSKVLIGFRVGDLWLDQFTYPADHKDPEKAGKPGASLKARLLFISWIKIDGELVYKAERQDHAKEPGDEAPNSESAQSASDSNIGVSPPPASESTAAQAAA